MLDYPQGEPGLNGIPGQDGMEVKKNSFPLFLQWAVLIYFKIKKKKKDTFKKKKAKHFCFNSGLPANNL